MLVDLIRVLTLNGPVTIKKNLIIAIDRIEEGTRIVVGPDEPKVYISVEDYDRVVLSYLSVA